MSRLFARGVRSAATPAVIVASVLLSMVHFSTAGGSVSDTEGPRGAHAAVLEREQLRMGTRLRMKLRGDTQATLEQASTRAFEEVGRLEGILSGWRADSELSAFNRAATSAEIPLSEDLFFAFDAAQRVSRQTRGAFDPTVEPLVRAWDLRGSGRLPDEGALVASLAAVGYDGLRLDAGNRTASLSRGDAGVDLGGIGKGYALDRIRSILGEHGVTSALVDFGGAILAHGEAEPDVPWDVAIADPEHRERSIARVRVRNAAISTSGQSERSVEAGSTRVGHILDPRTGRPVPAWGSVTVIGASATDSDGLSTALFVMGPEQARAWSEAQDDVAVILAETLAAGGTRVTIAGNREVWVQAGDLAQADPPARTTPASGAPDNAELSRRIDILAAEIEEMKLTELALTGGSVYGLGPAASKVYHIPRGVSLGGYGEVVYENYAERREDDRPSGRRDRVDFLRSVLYVGYKYTDRLVFNSELEFEHAATGRDGTVSVEFATLDYQFRRRMAARAGLLLVPMGFINELHEPPVFLGALRPDVERQIIPSTWRANGIGFAGETRGGLSMRAYLIEGLRGDRFAAGGLREGRQHGSNAPLRTPSWTVRVDWESTFGLLVGGSGFTGSAAQGPLDTLTVDIRTTLYEAHVQYAAKALRLRALYAGANINDVAELNRALGLTGAQGVGERLQGAYVEVGYDLFEGLGFGPDLPAGEQMALLPFARYEMYDTQARVPSGFTRNPANERTVLTIGASLHPHPQVVLKADWQDRRTEARNGVNQWNLGAGYLF